MRGILSLPQQSQIHSNKADKYKLYRELQNCLETVGPVNDKPLDEVVERVKSATTSLRRVLLSPLFSEFSDNGPVDMMDEDAISNLPIRVKINLTVWDFVLPSTPSLPAVFGSQGPNRYPYFQLEVCAHPFFDELRDPNVCLPNGRALPPLLNFTAQGRKVFMEQHMRVIELPLTLELPLN
ncbi:hypothetical protein L484_022190 [Morus notabilis]|uniref:Uncharacterized protein n=1 Tax=Morus notabilis TaxID=981085 RepID=W9RNE8_9ROSA|nr:hypothetical protein L484_022190 [Morus notabilis]